MPRRKRPEKTTRSEHWLRTLINQQLELIDSELNEIFQWNGDSIQWISPIADDSYAEYYDETFLKVLGIKPEQVKLGKFWPKGGPRWDGLANTSGGRVILLEAKAYIEEAVDEGTKAGRASKSRVLSALEQTRTYLNGKSNDAWSNEFYQYANRIAHLYYLSVLNDIDAYLVFVYFNNAPDVPSPCTREQWNGAIRIIKSVLGLGRHRLSSRIAEVFIDAGELME